MTDESQDIKELESLLGHTRSQYRTMQHKAVLRSGELRRQVFFKRPVYAVAASTALIAGFGALLFADFGGSSALPPSRLATASSLSVTTPAPPTATTNIGTLSQVGQRSVRFRMPTRPTGTSG